MRSLGRGLTSDQRNSVESGSTGNQSSTPFSRRFLCRYLGFSVFDWYGSALVPGSIFRARDKSTGFYRRSETEPPASAQSLYLGFEPLLRGLGSGNISGKGPFGERFPERIFSSRSELQGCRAPVEWQGCGKFPTEVSWFSGRYGLPRCGRRIRQWGIRRTTTARRCLHFDWSGSRHGQPWK